MGSFLLLFLCVLRSMFYILSLLHSYRQSDDYPVHFFRLVVVEDTGIEGPAGISICEAQCHEGIAFSEVLITKPASDLLEGRKLDAGPQVILAAVQRVRLLFVVGREEDGHRKLQANAETLELLQKVAVIGEQVMNNVSDGDVGAHLKKEPGVYRAEAIFTSR